MSRGDWLVEGVAARTMFGHPNPVLHVLVPDPSRQTGRGLWCSGGPGREFAGGAHSGTGGARPCLRCATLAKDAIRAGDTSPDDVRRFLAEDEYVALTKVFRDLYGED